MIKAAGTTDLTRAQTRTLAELSAAMNAHERRNAHCTPRVDTGFAKVSTDRTVVAATGGYQAIDEPHGGSGAATVRRLAAGSPVYGIAPCTTGAHEDTFDRPLPIAIFGSLGGGNPVIVFAQPPIVRAGDGWRRILGFYVHGVDRRRRTPCASSTPQADLGLLFVCKTLGTSIDRSDSDLVRIVVPRTFAQFTLGEAVRESHCFDEDDQALAGLLRVAVGVFLDGDRVLRHCEPLPVRCRGPR